MSNFKAKATVSMGVLFIGCFALNPVEAGSVTSESIWDENNALQKAQNQVPTGRTITHEHCTEIEVLETSRYRCTVTYD